MKRAILCGMFNFPRGSATANYIQYLAKALYQKGYEVYVLSNINSDYYNSVENGRMVWNGIKVIEPYFYTTKRGLKHAIFWHVLKVENSFKKTLKNFHLTEKDILVSYTNDPKIHEAVLSSGKATGTKWLVCITEWWEEKDFSNSESWNNFNESFEKYLPQYDLILPISVSLQNHFSEIGCNTMLLPIMADTSEYEILPKKFQKRLFVFPGNGKIKDSIKEMLQAFAAFPEDSLRKIEVHITGMKQDEVAACVAGKESLIGETFYAHGWMEYSKLIELYQRAHFLILPRPNNHMSVNNFPSKVPEVMTHGVIPIISRVGDCTELYLQDGVDSIIFEGDSVEACKAAIKLALSMGDDRVKNMSKAARECALTRFDYKNWSEKIIQAISSCDK